MRSFLAGAALAAMALLAGCAVPIRIDLQPGEKVTLKLSPTPVSTSTVSSDGKRMAAPDKSQPVQITADRMQYQDQGQVTVFTGHVRVNQESAWLLAPYLEVQSRDGLAYARGGVRLIDHYRGITLTAKEMDYRRNLADVEVRKNVRVLTHDDQGQPLRIRCDRLDWNTEAETARAREQVVVHYKNITATAGDLRFSQEAETLLLLPPVEKPGERPEIIRGWDRITGEQITLRIKDRVYEVEGSARAVVLPEERQADSKPAKQEQVP
ncbi:MAG: LptA/OstA family protein [candidate division FCPU426 bacterium]